MASIHELDNQPKYQSCDKVSCAELGFPSAGLSDGWGIAHGERLSKVLIRVAVLEFAVVMLVCGMTSVAYYRFILMQWPPAGKYLLEALFIAASVVVVSLGMQQLTDIAGQRRHRFPWNGVGAIALAFSFLLSTMFLLKVSNGYSRGTFFFQFVTVSIALLGLRTTVHRQLHAAIASGRVEARRLIVIGNPTDCRRFAARLQGTGDHLAASFQFPSPGPVENAWPKVAEVQTIIDAGRALRVDDIVILLDADELAPVLPLAAAFSELPVTLHILPSSLEVLLRSARVTHLGSVSTIQVFEPPLSVFDQLLKRAFDFTIAATLLIVLAPLLVIVSIAIQLDSRGPILYRQTRHGYNNETFRIFKFRSMTTTDDNVEFVQAVKGDQRVTRVGRLLRSRNIDELPQLLNVLLGHMSIVGPRPHPIILNERFSNQISPFYRRHNIKPGITGWAQVNGYRGETDTFEKMQRRLDFDLHYIDNWSFMFDIKIILMTLFSKSAYTNAH